MGTKASELTQSGYRQLRTRVARVLIGDGEGIHHPVEPEHVVMAERLIDAGCIDVDEVMGLPGA